MPQWRFLEWFRRTPRYKFFVSYSRADESIVDYLISFLRVATEKVFRDTANIPPGSVWPSETAKAIENCETVLLFWCKHSASSGEVRKEFITAIEHERKVVPVLLDESALPSELSNLQGVDLRDMGHDRLLEELEEFEERSRPSPSDDFVIAWKMPRPRPENHVALRFLDKLEEILES